MELPGFIKEYFPFSEDYTDVYLTVIGFTAGAFAVIVGMVIFTVLLIPWCAYFLVESVLLWSYKTAVGFFKKYKK